MAAGLAPLQFPKGAFTLDYLQELTDQLLAVACSSDADYAKVLPIDQVQSLIKRTTAILRKEPALIEV